MFESILERILNTYFGRFISGFDSNNLHLGVWKGDIKIENVSIRNDLMDNLEFPLKIKYSNIGSLIIKVPWTKLSSMPVQIIMEDIFMIVEPIDEKNWNFQDDKALNRKLTMCIEKFLMKQDQNALMGRKELTDGDNVENSNNQTYMGKLTKRIIDNLELTIKKIHFRWEDKVQQYGWGVSLEELSVYTCDQEWNKKFQDGSKSQDKLLRKLGEIKNLSFYWNDSETEFFTRDQTNTSSKMLAYIFQQDVKKEVFNLCVNIKISQKIDGNEVICQVEQQKLEFVLKELQLIQITKLLEKISMYKKLLWMVQNDQKKPEEEKLTEQELEEYKNQFLEIMGQLKQQNQNLIPEDIKKTQLPIILRNVKYEVLFEWARECAKKIIKAETIDYELEKKRKQKWFFQRGNETITKEEQDEIEKKIELEFSKEKDFLDTTSELSKKSTQDSSVNSSSRSNNSNNMNAKKKLLAQKKKQKKLNLTIDFNLHILSIVLQEGPNQNLQLDVNKIHFFMVDDRGDKQTIEFTVRNVVLFQGIKGVREIQRKEDDNSNKNAQFQNYMTGGKNLSMDSPFITSPISLLHHQQSRQTYKKVNKYIYCPKSEENYIDFADEEQGHLEDFQGKKKHKNGQEEQKYQDDEENNESDYFSSTTGNYELINESGGKKDSSTQKKRTRQSTTITNPFLNIILERTKMQTNNNSELNLNSNISTNSQESQQNSEINQSQPNNSQNTNFQDDGDNIIKCKSYLKCRIQPLVVIYDKDFIERTKKFFEIKNQDEFLKSATWQKIEQIQDETSNRVSRAMKQQSQTEWIIDTEIYRQKIRIPLETSDSLWELKIPKISIKNINTNSSTTIQHNAYIEKVGISLRETNITTYLIKDYTLQAEIIQNKSHQNTSQQHQRFSTTRIQQDEPRLKTTLLLPSLNLELNEALCNKILLIPQAFKLKKNKKQEKREKLKQKLLSNCTHKGYIQCKKNFEWNKYYVIFAGAYLYFFNDDQISSSDIIKQVYIKNSLILSSISHGNNNMNYYQQRKSTTTRNFQLHPYTLNIKNRYDQCELACSGRKELMEWTQKLTQKVEEYATIEELIRLKEKEEEELEDQNESFNSQDKDSLLQEDKSFLSKSEDQKKQTTEEKERADSRNMQKRQYLSLLSISMDKLNLKIIKSSLRNQDSPDLQQSQQQNNKNIRTQSTNKSNKTDNSEEQNEQDYYIDLSLYKFKLENKSYDNEKHMSIQFKQLVLLDGTFKFTNEIFQPLIQTEKNSFAEILIISRNNNNKINIANKEIIVTIDKALINWKPDTILKIRDWNKMMNGQPIRTLFKEEDDMSIEQLLQEALNRNHEREQAFTKSSQTVKDKYQLYLNYDQASEAGRCSQLLFDMSLQFKQIDINLIHRTTHMGIYNLKGSNISATFKKTAEAKYLDGNIRDCIIYDITNYPKTIDSNINFDQVKPTALVGRKIGAENSKKNIGRFRFSSYQDYNIYNKDRVTSFLELDFYEIFAVYQQQPIMRLINYIVNYFVWIFLQPEYLTMNDDYFALKTVYPDLQPKSVWGSKIEMLQKILFPTFMDIRVYLHDSLVLIKPFPQFTEYFQLNSQFIEVFNVNFSSNRRYKKQMIAQGADRMFELSEEDWIIHVHPLTIQHVKDNKIYKDISTLTRYNMKWNRMNFFANLNYLYPDLTTDIIDSGFWIRSELEPLSLKLFRNEYIHIIRMIIHNFTQNDFKDEWFNHSQKVQQLFKPAVMNFYLDFPNVSVFAMSRVDNIPHIKLNVDRMRLKWLKSDTGNIVIAIYGESIHISYYDKVDNNNLLEKCLLGEDILKVQKVKLLGQSSENLQIDHAFVLDRQYSPLELSSMVCYGFDDQEFIEQSAQLTFYENMFFGTGDKDMLLRFQGVKIFVKSSTIMNVAAWSAMQQDCWPQKDTWDDLTRIVFMADLIDCHLILPNESSDLVLFTRGEISYVFMRQKMKQQEDLRERFIKGQIDNEYLNDMGDVYTFSVTLKDLELYRCHIGDLNKTHFEQIPRRSILMPMNFLWHMNKFIQIAGKPHNPVYFNVRHDINLDKTAIKFSYKDILLIQRVAEYQKKDLANIKKDPDQVKMKQDEDEAFKKDPKNSQETPSQTVYDIVLHGTKVFVINDGEGSCVPVLELALNDTQMVYNTSSVKSILSAIVKLSFSFYNPSTSKWEPIIERTALDFDVSLNNFANPRKYIILELNPEYDEININISRELIKIFKHTLISWKREIQILENEEKQYQQKMKQQNLTLMDEIYEVPEEMEDNHPTLSSKSSQLTMNQNQNDNNNNFFLQPTSSQGINFLKVPSNISQGTQKSLQLNRNSSNLIQQQQYQSPDKFQILMRDQFAISTDMTQRPDSLALVRETSTKYQEITTEKESLEYVSPYTIRNELGYAISIHSDLEKKYSRITYGSHLLNTHPGYTIPSWTEMNYQIDSDIYTNFFNNSSNAEKRTITLNLKHPFLEFEPITGIDLDSVQKTKHLLQYKQDKTADKIQLIIEVIPQATRKMIIFRSSMTFINKLDETLEIQLLDPSGLPSQSFINQGYPLNTRESQGDNNIEVNSNSEENQPTFFLVGSNQRLCIPFDKINNILLFRFSQQQCYTIKQVDGQDCLNSSKWSQKIDLRKISDLKQEIISFPIKHTEDKISMIKFIKRTQGECIIQAEPSIIVKNCLPLQIKYKLYFVNSESNEKDTRTSDGILQVQQEIQSHYVSLDHRVYIQLQVHGYQWSTKLLLYSPESSEIQTDKIEIFDYQQYSQHLEIQKSESIFGSKKYFIYTPQFIINETPYDIFYFNQLKKKKLQIVSGQRISAVNDKFVDIEEKNQPTSKICFLSNFQNVIMSLNENGTHQSQLIDLQIFGKNTIDLKVPTEGEPTSLYQFGMNVSLICADSAQQIYVKSITISPRYILVNKTQYDMSACQSTEEKNVTQIDADKRLPFYWTDCNKKQHLRIRIQDPNEGTWGWSGSIDVQDPQTNMISFSLRNQRNDKHVKFMKLDVREDEHLIYLVFHECIKEDEAVYMIENKLEDIDVEVCQKDQQQYFLVSPHTNQQFAWEQPQITKHIQVDLKFKGKYLNLYEIEPLTIDLQDNDSEREYEICSLINEDEFLKFYVMICIEGSTKKVKFYFEHEIHERNKLEDNLDIQVGANIKSLNIGLISWNKLKRQEIALCSLKNIEFVMLQTQSERTCQLKIGFIQIDNNISHSASYPVVFTPTAFEKMQKLNRPHFSLILVQNIMVKNIKIIKSVKCQLQASTVKMTDCFLDCLINFLQECSSPVIVNQKLIDTFLSEVDNNANQGGHHRIDNMKNIMNKGNRVSSTQTLFGDNSNFLHSLSDQFSHSSELKNQNTIQFEWQYSKLPNVNAITFINEIEIYPIYLDLSFKANTKEDSANQSFFVLNIFKAIGLAFKNIDNASVKLKRTKLQNVLDTTSGAIKRITKSYYIALISIFLNMIGSLNLIANPLGFAKSIYIGFSDLISYPIEGFIKGPVEGSISVFKGIGNLAKNTISGSFNSVQSLTEPLSTVCSTLSLDDIYIEKRANIISLHPKHAFEGVGIGVWALANGIQRGIVGLVDIPYNEAKKKGFVGLLKGSMKGISGVMFKPICGGIDFISKTAEGIKNTVTFFDDKPSNRRMRRIRPFYGIDQYYKEFDEVDARIIQLFNDNMKGKYKDEIFIASFILMEFEQARQYMNSQSSNINPLSNEQNRSGNELLLVITIRYIILMSYKDKKLIWDVDAKNISQITSTDHTIKIMQKLPSNKLQIFEIVSHKKDLTDTILGKINFIKENAQKQKDSD